MVDRRGDDLLRLTWTDYLMKLVGALRVASEPGGPTADAVRRLVREASAAADDPNAGLVIDALWGMPDNLVWTPLGEADAVRAWLREVAPRPAVRIGSGAAGENGA